MDVNYRDAVMRRDDPHPFGAALSVRSTVVSAAQPGFVITDAGVKELDAIFGIDNPSILRGAPARRDVLAGRRRHGPHRVRATRTTAWRWATSSS